MRSSLCTCGLSLVALVLAACERGSPAGPSKHFELPPAQGPSGAARCLPMRAADPVPARSSVLSAELSTEQTVFTRDLFNDFSTFCGGCHVAPANQGGFQVTLESFRSLVDHEVVERMLSDDAKKFMPPPSVGGKPASQRSSDDPVLALIEKLRAWIEAGRPGDHYTVSVRPDGASPYLMGPEHGLALTNLGDCIPERRLVASEAQRSAELDELFAAESELPERLEETDLFTLDSATLARHGVISFAPAYTLWSDNARKMRYVRVPRGQSIAFSEATQSFDITANTRFYKTFLKEVVDAQGQRRYRKMETRIIVARPDRKLPDGTYEVTALFGTYAWNEQETEAVLVRDPLRNGKPFRDRLVTYVTDEPAAERIKQDEPENLLALLELKGLTRTYAIPGSERCIQCHMGDPQGEFVLGFTPLQLKRRPLGEGGVIEPAGEDELTQLERLVDYGVITGISSPEQILPLEKSQGARAPRNEHELAAQGYMLGNCAHCHNLRGFPTVGAPVLRDVLNFYPSPDGGIFQFPLERMSPRITRGNSPVRPIPYLSPSLEPDGTLKAELLADGSTTDDILAPWHSLIYRNVDSMFTYAEDAAVFPHMPMNVPGFDCRAPLLMGKWMLSIPARQASTSSSQPYEEVRPGDADYEAEQSRSRIRLTQFQLDARVAKCVNPPDIVDPGVIKGRQVTPWNDQLTGLPVRPHWVTTDLSEVPGPWTPRREKWREILVDGEYERILDPIKREKQKQVLEMLRSLRITDELRSLALDEIPFGLWVEKKACDFAAVPKVGNFTGERRPRWFDYGYFDSPVDGFPDRPVYMLSRGEAVFTNICANCHGPKADSRGRQADTLALLSGGNTRVANLRDGLFGPAGMPGENQREVFGALVAPSVEHTPQEWAGSYLAWMALGGTERVIPSAVLDVVASAPVLGVLRKLLGTPEDANMLASAQLMCASVLPSAQANLAIDVQQARAIYDHDVGVHPLIRTNGDAELWEALCTFENPLPIRVLIPPTYWRARESSDSEYKALQAPVLAASGATLYSRVDPRDPSRSSYPADAPVGNQHGQIELGVHEANRSPWCIKRPADPAELEVAEQFVRKFAPEGVPELPFCPEALFAQVDGNERYRLEEAAIDRWVTRGAITAGLSVFLHVDALARGRTPKPPYDQCEQLRP